ncbi:DNA-binding virion protein [Eptesipox virus]|uniref:Core protein VP8 n=1 Tax=Eptesipox virus TaxID=1329402 RepID=A0A220T6C5_9POXV|nr:DNA-binding virion protein [Eptesipox virus]ASK51268.1 DNA-binding virion protein [Eptesipox virus]WAH71026.1 DNA-binding virion protein [Eptesipox virus]
MSRILENLFDEDMLFCAGSAVDYDNIDIMIAGAKVKYPRSFLSIFNIIPRTMTKYQLELIQTENITGAVFSTAYNIKKNLSMGDDKLTIEAITNYYLDPNNEVLTLMVNNTSLANVTPRKKSKRNKNPVVFRQGSVPLLFIFESKKKMSVYKEDPNKLTSDGTYTKISDSIALINKYATMTLADIHTPSVSMKLNAIYGFTHKHELRKLSTNKELDEYSKMPLQEPVRLNDFVTLYDSIKKNISLTNIPTID